MSDTPRPEGTSAEALRQLSSRSRLADMSVHRPVSTVMVMLGILVVGAIAFSRIQVEQWPSGATFPYLYVQAPAAGVESYPREVEREVTIPLENAIRTTSGLRSSRARSAANGTFLWLEFDSGTDMNVAYLDLKGRLEQASAALPEEVEKVTVGRIATGDEPCIVYAVTWPDVDFDQTDPFYPIENTIAGELAYVDGVASVEVDGLLTKSVRILVDRDRAASLGINLYELVQSLRASNADIESGDIVAGGNRLFLRSLGRWQSLQEVRDFPVSVRSGGFASSGGEVEIRTCKLGDFAELREVYSVARTLSKLNGHYAARLEIFKNAGANSVEVCDRIREQVARLQAEPDLSDYEFVLLDDEGEDITKNTSNLERTLGLGSILAFIVLLGFLHRFWVTTTICLAIPMSLLMGLVAIYFTGGTLNALTLMGFTLAAGMLVDNSVVVVESIFARREAGEERRLAAVRGAGEIGMAIVLATMTSIAVYLPSILLADNAFMKLMLENIGWPVCYALAASLVVALLFIPLVSTFTRQRPAGGRRTIVERVADAYQRSLARTVHRRTDVFVVLLLIAVAAAYLSSRLEQTDENSGGDDRMSVFCELPGSYDLARAEELIDRFTAILLEHREDLGFRFIQSRIRPGVSRLRLYLDEPLTDSEEKDALFARVKALLPVVTGVDVRTSWRQSDQFDYAKALTIQLSGPDSDTLDRIATEVVRRLERIEGLDDVTTDTQAGPEELRVSIDRQLAGAMGVDSRVVMGTVQYALRGQRLPPFRPRERETMMILEYDEAFTEGLTALRNIPLWLPRSNIQVPLASILERVEGGKGQGNINRVDGMSSLSVAATLSGDDLESVRRRVDDALEDLHLPRGYDWSKGGRFTQWREDFTSLFIALALSAACVFILMAVLFESLVLPLSIFASVIMAWPGVVLALWVSRTAMDRIVIFGMIILVGIVVNNAIVLVDRINRLRSAGMSREHAIVTAGRDRFRPILMTAITTVIGLVPMAFGDSGTGIPYAPLGKTVMGGMITSTLLTLYAVPAFYTLFDDLGQWSRRVGAILVGSR